MASVNLQELVVFLLLIQRTWAHHDGSVSSQPITTSDNQNDVPRVVLKERDRKSDSKYQSKLVQIGNLGEKFVKTGDYSLVPSQVPVLKHGWIISRSSPIDSGGGGQPVVLLIKAEHDLDDVNLVVSSEYLANFVYDGLRAEGPFRLEEPDAWIYPQSSVQTLRSTSFRNLNPDPIDHVHVHNGKNRGDLPGNLLDSAERAVTTDPIRWDDPPRNIGQERRIVKRGLFDGVFSSVIASKAFIVHPPVGPKTPGAPTVSPPTITGIESESKEPTIETTDQSNDKNSNDPDKMSSSETEPVRTEEVKPTDYSPHAPPTENASTDLGATDEGSRTADASSALPHRAATASLASLDSAPKPMVRRSTNSPPKSKKDPALSKKAPEAQPKELLSNRIYLVKPSWYPSVVEESRVKAKGRSIGLGPNNPPFLETKAIKGGSVIKTKKGGTITRTSANARTRFGKASARSLNKKGGIAVANAEVQVKGDAHAISTSVGKGLKDTDKVAVANAHTVNGGVAVAKAETDGYAPTASIDSGFKPGEIADPYAFLKETDKEFQDVLDISSGKDAR